MVSVERGEEDATDSRQGSAPLSPRCHRHATYEARHILAPSLEDLQDPRRADALYPAGYTTLLSAKAT